MLLGDVGDELLDEDGLAHAGAAEEADLAASGVGGQQVDDLDAGLQHLRHGALVLKGGGLPVDGQTVPGDVLPAVDGLPQDVEHPPQGLLAHGHRQRSSQGPDLHAPGQALGGVQQDAPDHMVSHMLRRLHDQALAVVVRLQGVLEPGQVAVRKADVHHRPHDLYDFSIVHG